LERLIEILAPMIRGRSCPSEELVEAMEQRDRAELLLAFVSHECLYQWAAEVGPYGDVARDSWKLLLPNAGDAEIIVFGPIKKAQEQHGGELPALRRHHEAVLNPDPAPPKLYQLQL